MKAIVYSEYGGPEVLHLTEVEEPSPRSEEVLIRIYSVSVNYGDILARNIRNLPLREFNMPLLFWFMARLNFGWNKPRRSILGNTFSGEIVTVGHAVKKFRPGDKVFGFTAEKMGALAEYLTMPENGILGVKPANMTFDEASTIPYGAAMAWDLLKKVKIENGQKVLVVGASGGIGSAAVQLAGNYFGTEVAGVCGEVSSGFVKSLGAVKVIDYRREDFSKSGEKYDLIFDVLGHGTFSKYKSLLTDKGVYLSVSFKFRKLLQMLWTSAKDGKKVLCAQANPEQQDLILIKQIVEAGKFKAIVDRSFPLEKAPQAHRYYESGNKKGNIVITLIKN